MFGNIIVYLPSPKLNSLGVFSVEEHHAFLTVCPRHQEVYGVGWSSGKVWCSVPIEMAGHKSLTAKGDHGISSKESSYIFFAGNTFLPIGTREYQQLFSIS